MNPSCWSALGRVAHVVCVAACVMAACASRAGSEVSVSAQPPNGTYEATARHLVSGGVVYGIVDFSGDAEALRRFLADYREPAKAEWPWREVFDVRLDPLVDLLGLSDIEAAGVSSTVRADGLYDNRTYFHMPRGRHGLLEALGDEPGPFTTAGLAPPDVDFFYETQFDLAGAYQVSRGGVAEVFGRGASDTLDGFLDEALASVGGVTVRDLVEHAHGRFSVVMVMDPDKTAFVDLDLPVKVPACEVLVRIEGVGRALVPFLDQVPVLELSIREGRRHYAMVGRPWVSTWTPAIVIDHDVVYFGSSQAFIHACIGRKDGLATSAAFVSAIAELGGEGNSITWLSPRMGTFRKRVLELNEGSRSSHIKDLRSWLPAGPTHTVSSPLVSMRRNLADGILYRSRWDVSLKRDVFSVTLLNPVTIAMTAGIVEPQYRRAREYSQEIAIYSNLRRLQVHARQYCYDHRLTTVPVRTIMGDEPGKLVPTLKPVAGEDYSELVFRENYALSVRTEDGRIVEYGP